MKTVGTMGPRELERAVDEHLAQTGRLLSDDTPAAGIVRALHNGDTQSEAARDMTPSLYDHWRNAHRGLFEAFPDEPRMSLGLERVGLHKAMAAAVAGAISLRECVGYEGDGPVTLGHIRRVLSISGVMGLATGAGRRRLSTIYGVLPALSVTQFSDYDFIA